MFHVYACSYHCLFTWLSNLLISVFFILACCCCCCCFSSYLPVCMCVFECVRISGDDLLSWQLVSVNDSLWNYQGAGPKTGVRMSLCVCAVRFTHTCLSVHVCVCVCDSHGWWIPPLSRRNKEWMIRCHPLGLKTRQRRGEWEVFLAIGPSGRPEHT